MKKNLIAVAIVWVPSWRCQPAPRAKSPRSARCRPCRSRPSSLSVAAPAAGASVAIPVVLSAAGASRASASTAVTTIRTGGGQDHGMATEAPAAALPPTTTTDASGRADIALSAEISLWARAGSARTAPRTIATAIRFFFMMRSLKMVGPVRPGVGGAARHAALHARIAQVGLVGVVAKVFASRESAGDQVKPAHAQEGLVRFR